jgi:hypothetical protein
VAQLFQRLLKFGRRLGLSFVAVVHHLSDVIDGAAAKEAAAILKMASTRTIYMQKSDEARATGKVLGLPRWAVEIIPTLSPGMAVWDVNGDVQVVKHIVTEFEKPLVYTDRAMTESSALPEVEAGPIPPALEPVAPPALEPVLPVAARALPPTRAVSAMQRLQPPPLVQQPPLVQPQPQVPPAHAQPSAAPQAEPLPQTVAPRLNATRRPEPLSSEPLASEPLSSEPLASEPLEPERTQLPPQAQGPGPGYPLLPLAPDDGLDDGFEDDPDGELDEEYDEELEERFRNVAAAGADAAPEDAAEMPAPVAASPVLRPVPPPALATARPTADDPELTALAAALFGPRAQTPSHPRRAAGRPRPNEDGSVH